MSIDRKGKQIGRKGKPHTEETKQKIREIRARQAPITEAGRRKISEINKGRVPWNKGKKWAEELDKIRGKLQEMQEEECVN